MNPQQALQYIAQALNDYAQTMPVSVRVAFVEKTDAAFKILTTPPKQDLPDVAAPAP